MSWPWLRRGFDNGAATSLAVTLVTVLIVGILSYSTIQSFLVNDARVSRSYEALDALSAVQADLRDAETGQRGYLLTGADRYLEPYRTGSVQTRRDLDRLREMTRGDAGLEAETARLDALAQAKLAELALTLQLASQSGRPAGVAQVGTGRGEDLMRQAQQAADAIRSREQILLFDHTRSAEAAGIRAATWTFFGTVVSSLLIITALVFVGGYLRQRSNAEIENVRLSVLAEEFASRQRTFLRDVLFSVTEGRLRFCESPRELPGQIPTIGERIMLTKESGLGSLRAHALEAARMCGIGEERGYDLITSACEAGMNAISHAGGGTALICSDNRRRVQVWIEDQGTGIDLDHLPQATLERGYSTAGTLGHGFFMILQMVDRVYLLTGPTGTTVVLEQYKTALPRGWVEAQMLAIDADLELDEPSNPANPILM
jgi:CHASE3 domain sensor protein/anti-sigma regulatory factor (Ser/Thr protein kinase)